MVFLAWGTPAGKRVSKVDLKKHLVLKSVHPSPLSASRGWFDCGHFKKTNEWLVGKYGEGSEINWDLGDVPVTPAPPPVVVAPAPVKEKWDEEDEESELAEEELKALGV